MIPRTPFQTPGRVSLRNDLIAGFASGAASGAATGIRARLRDRTLMPSWSLADDAGGRFVIDSMSGVVTTAATLSRPCGSLTLPYLTFPLYDGGPCPIVASQINVRYVDPVNGDNAANGTTMITPWKSLRGKTVQDAIIYLIGEGSVATPVDPTAGYHWCGSATLKNCTIRPLGEIPIRLVNTTDYTRSCFAFRYNDGAYNDLTLYKIETEGWNQGHLVTRCPRLRWLRCASINVGNISGGASNQYHGWYIGGVGADEMEIAYCWGDSNRANRSGAFLHFYGSNPGPTKVAIHHNYTLPNSKWTWGLLIDAATPRSFDVFNNTFTGAFHSFSGPLGLTNSGGHNAYADSTVRFRSNIVHTTISDAYVVYAVADTAATWGGTNTGFGGSGVSGLTAADWGVIRDPVFDANGVATSAAEKGSGDTIETLPALLDSGQRVSSSLTNVDRGHRQYGPSQPERTQWRVRVRDAVSLAARWFFVPVS